MSESLFRTAKYRPDFPFDGLSSIEHAQQWCFDFVQWYNETHKHSAIKFVTPSQRHSGADVQILAKRDGLYLRARQANPARLEWRHKELAAR